MRPIFAGFVLVCLPAAALSATDPPLAEKYLHSGELARGEQSLLAALEKDPKDDQARFGLGVLQFVRAVERLGQSLHEYGARADETTVPFLRLPVPKNDKPSAISYRALGRVFDVLIADLTRAERTLAKVRDPKVKLRLRLAAIRFDLTGGGKPTDKFLDVLVKLNGGVRFGLLEDNPDFLVCFDRGDVAWLRAYCHLLCAGLEGYRAFDLRAGFDQRVKDVFPKVELTGEKAKDGNALVIADGARLGRLRKHLLAVCELNRETWKFIRAEADDDHEWLPNPKQKGVLGLPVTNAMIDRWLAMVGQLEGLLEGERLFPGSWLGLLFAIDTDGKGLNVKTLLIDPPASISHEKLEKDGIDPKYLDGVKGKKEFDLRVLFAVGRAFNGPLGLGYMAWFN